MPFRVQPRTVILPFRVYTGQRYDVCIWLSSFFMKIFEKQSEIICRLLYSGNLLCPLPLHPRQGHEEKMWTQNAVMSCKSITFAAEKRLQTALESTSASKRKKERCSSGWRGTPGKRVYVKSVSGVRIPVSPQGRKGMRTKGVRYREALAQQESPSLRKEKERNKE